MPSITRKLCASLQLLATSLSLLVSTATAQQPGEPWEARPELVEKLSRQRSEFNYDETKVPSYQLPDPLVDLSGTPIRSIEQWPKRRAELLELFRDQVYGRRPTTQYGLSFQETAIVTDAFDGAATGRSMVAVITIDQRTFEFPFTIFVPNQSTSAAPVIVHINNRYFVPLEKAIAEPDDFWPVQKIIEKGFATASFHTSDVDPDNKDGYAKGVRAFFADGASPADDDWRSLSAWGWAASRLLDYAESLDGVDIHRSAVVGHSRGGKTALWAACEDERFAIAYSNNSGCGGAALSRRAYGETVGRITTAFPHWFCAHFARFAGRESELPVDQHEVFGLIAPRSVYVTSADEDLWADPRGEYQSLIASAPVFELLGEHAIREPQMPALNTPRVVGKTGYHIRTGGHGLEALDWDYFLDFALRQLQP